MDRWQTAETSVRVHDVQWQGIKEWKEEVGKDDVDVTIYKYKEGEGWASFASSERTKNE